MQPISLPPPFRGIKDDIPAVVVESPFCSRSRNFNFDDATAKLRKGDFRHTNIPGEFILNTTTYGFGATQKMFIAYDSGTPGTGIKFADASSPGTPTDVFSAGGVGGDDEIHTLFFNNVLTYFGENSLTPTGVGNPQWDGTTWGMSGFVFPSGFLPFGGNSYNKRAYFIGRGSTKYGYGPVNGISGPVVLVDLAQIVSEKANLYAIRKVALSEGIQQKVVQCFIFDSGEVICFSGTYPNSTDWEEVGRFVIPRPIYYNTVVDAAGDSFIITESALVSLRSLFTQGVDLAGVRHISDEIKNRWEQVVGFDWSTYGVNQIFIKGVFDKKRNRIVILMPAWIDYPANAGPDPSYCHRLIYSFKTQSWTEHTVIQVNQGGSTSGTIFNRELYYGGFGGVMKAEGSSGYMDNQLEGINGPVADLTYAFDLIFAPLPVGKSYFAKAAGVDVFIESDMYDRVSYQFIGDLGFSTTGQQKVTQQAVTIQKPFVDLGIEGSFLQLRISGSSTSGKTVGYELFSENIWAEQGKSPR